MSVMNFNKNNFEAEVLKSDKPVFVDFWASWCGPCKMQSPIFDAVAEENADVVFGKVNVDDEQELAMAFGVSTIPTLILFKDGEQVTRVVGVHSEDDLQEIIDENK